MTAQDDDCGLNSVIEYSLSAAGVFPPPEFTINPENGRISLATQLDFERRTLYEFPVMAFDKGMSTQHCIIYIIHMYVIRVATVSR